MKALRQSVKSSDSAVATQRIGKPSKAIVDNRPQMVTQRKIQEAIVQLHTHTSTQRVDINAKGRTTTQTGLVTPSSLVPIQRKTILLPDDGITPNMNARLSEAYALFNNKILSASPLAAGEANQVLVHGVSQKTQQMKDYATTTIYIGNKGYKGEDYSQFTNLWQWSLDEDLDKDTGIRIVIAVNLTINTTVEQLYATLLHEWFAHAVHWEGVVDYIRKGEGKFALAWVKGQGYERRAQAEHKAYATWSEQDIINKVGLLGLGEAQMGKVIKNLKTDVARHDMRTGHVH
jgi:hypothetical protein